MMRRTTLLAVIASLGGACRQSTTSMGDCSSFVCESGLLVHLVALPSRPFKVEIADSEATNTPVLASFECSGGASCRQDIQFSQLKVVRPVIRVSIGMAVATTTPGEVIYRPVYPNGADCPPRCLIGTVVANVPSGTLVSGVLDRLPDE